MIKLLVVDDSALMRRLLGELFAAEGDFAVTFARNGAEALDALDTVRPDVITLDVEMPAMDGLTCLDRIMIRRPTPVVVASAVTIAGADEALRAMDLGAVDVIAKPSGAISLRMDAFGPALVEKVRAATQARLSRTRRLRERVREQSTASRSAPSRSAPSRAAPSRAAPSRAASSRAAAPADKAPGAVSPAARRSMRVPPLPPGEGVVLVGASTGGPPALDALLAPLPADFPWPIVVAQHMPASFTAALARRLDGLTALTVTEVREPTPLEPGAVYVGRGDADVVLTRRGGVLTALSAPASSAFRWHPSVDRLVESAREFLPADRLVGVLMTGMGHDGAGPMARLRADGGHTLAQSEATSVVWGMPGELVRAGGASSVCDLEELASALLALADAP